jgi:hypothetical protein
LGHDADRLRWARLRELSAGAENWALAALQPGQHECKRLIGVRGSLFGNDATKVIELAV